MNKPSDSLRAKFSISLINETIKGKKKEKKRRKKGEKKREKKVKLPIVFKKKIDINLSRKTYTEPIRTRTMGTIEEEEEKCTDLYGALNVDQRATSIEVEFFPFIVFALFFFEWNVFIYYMGYFF